MNHELAKTLTIALVQFIDRERPEGTMCCSSAECERIESSFKLGDFPSIEQFVQKKLSRHKEDEKIIVNFFKNFKETGTWKSISDVNTWIAYLEKQKESLHFPETCEENANSFIDGIIEVRSFQRGMEEGRRLEKQKEQNDEDGFLEDELSAFLQNYDKEYDDDAAVSDVARHFYEIGKKQKEQKPLTDEEKEYIRTIKSIISDFIRDKKPENLAYYQRIYDWLDGRHVPFSCGHENDKPAEWSAEDENALEYIHDLISWGYSKKFMDAQTAHDMRKWVNEHLGPDTFQNGNSHWKPSEEQMEALKRASVNEYIPAKQFDILVSLYKQLKKLM